MENTAICLYCKRYWTEYDETDKCGYRKVGICRLKDEPRYWQSKACDRFERKKGIHTVYLDIK